MSKLLEAMKQALQVVLILFALVAFLSTLFAGVELLANGNPLVGTCIVLLVFFVFLTTVIYVEMK